MLCMYRWLPLVPHRLVSYNIIIWTSYKRTRGRVLLTVSGAVSYNNDNNGCLEQNEDSNGSETLQASLPIIRVFGETNESGMKVFLYTISASGQLLYGIPAVPIYGQPSICESIELLISAFSNSLFKSNNGDISITGSPKVNEIIPLFQ